MHISFLIHSSVIVLRNEEKLVALLVWSSLRREATSMLRRISLFTSSSSQVSQTVIKWKMKTESLPNQYSTAAPHSDRNDCDFIRLVATEHVRN